MDNHSLIEKIKNKDGEKILKELYKLYRDDFLLWAMKYYSCTLEEAQDEFQQVIVIFYENIISGKLIEITTKLKTYLFSIGKNKILERQRKAKKYIESVHEDYLIDTDLFYGNDDKKNEEDICKVEYCLEEIGEPCKSILVQFYYHQRTLEEISDGFEYKNRDTVKSMKYKCLKRLKNIYHSQALNVNR